jgi:hypothetical protein
MNHINKLAKEMAIECGIFPHVTEFYLNMAYTIGLENSGKYVMENKDKIKFFYRIEDIANFLNVSKPTIRSRMKDGYRVKGWKIKRNII